MLKKLFGEITNGRLMRLPYLGYSLLLAALFLGFGIAVGLMIGTGEQLMGGDLQQAQAKLAEWLSIPFMVVFGLVVALIVFAGANIMAKRIRDIGAGKQRPVSPELALLLIPTDTFAKGAREPHS